MRYIETYEDFKEKEVKESITPHIIEEWEFREDRSVEQVELIKLLKNKISCELIDISFSKDEKPCYYIDKKILRINVEEEQQWEWDEFVKLYKDIRYLVIRNANRISSKIFQISNLVYLELYCCDLTELSYEGISNLKNIETLSLEGSMVNKIDKHIFTLENLKNFSVMHTSIKEIPEDLCSLKKLRYIGLNGTKIKEVPKAIAKIEGLTDLYLGQTDICEFPIEMKNLKKLERLALWETQLEELPDWICEYKYLRGLYLGRTKKLCCLPERIGELINLEQLYLDGTQLNYLPKSFGNLINLKDLSLKGTKIRKFPPLREMKHLITCDLSNMILERIPGEFLESDMEIQPEMDFPNNGLILANTKLLCQPISLFSHEKAFIKTYYEEKKIHLNETKIVFLGDGEAGKSHIIERIKKDNHLLKTFKEESTPGIAISQKLCDVDGELIRLQIWDFGGQEIMHSMHRFFLTERTLYVIVINARDNTQDERAEYWLNNVKNFANGCPVIMVLNKMDQNPTASINERLLRNDYPQIVKIIKMSAMKDNVEKFGELMSTVISTIRTFDSYAMDFPVSWNKIKIRLMEMNSNYITDREYRKICSQYMVEDEQIQNWLLDWFHDLGISFNYHKKDQLLGAYMVLKPTWITNAIYIILFNGGSYAQNGIISINNIISLLKNPPKSVENIRYNIIEVPYILGVMRRFEISYSVDKDSEFIPMMCDKNQHVEAEDFINGDCLEYFMEYEYLPNNVLHKLMIKMQEKLMKDKIWLTGMILVAREKNIFALVRMHEKRIEIFIRSLNNNLYPSKEFLR
ncbi:COR domain-containing protein [Blautia sp.]|jgi:internalin A|uniref:COR domain-containing protein n=1 Tax=Blautia sp. TaxID=1955243 RepID=UPI0025893B86|nr:COR domain-containing protein [Blautia sp.]